MANFEDEWRGTSRPVGWVALAASGSAGAWRLRGWARSRARRLDRGSRASERCLSAAFIEVSRRRGSAAYVQGGFLMTAARARPGSAGSFKSALNRPGPTRLGRATKPAACPRFGRHSLALCLDPEVAVRGPGGRGCLEAASTGASADWLRAPRNARRPEWRRCMKWRSPPAGRRRGRTWVGSIR